MRFYLLAVMLLTMLSACQNNESASPQVAVEHTATEWMQQQWQLVELKQQAFVASELQRAPTLAFEQTEARAFGFNGCNRYFATVVIDVSAQQIAFSQMGSTMMACLPDMDVESAFMQALTEVTAYRLVNQQLELLDAAQQVLMVLVLLNDRAR